MRRAHVNSSVANLVIGRSKQANGLFIYIYLTSTTEGLSSQNLGFRFGFRTFADKFCWHEEIAYRHSLVHRLFR